MTVIVKNGSFLISSMLVLASCASAPGNIVGDKEATRFKHDSMANNMLAVADYTGVISDSRYSADFNALTSGVSAATLLPQNFDISAFSAFGLGAILTSLNEGYPFRQGFSYIVFQPITGKEDVGSPAFVEKVIKDNFVIDTPTEKTSAYVKGMLEKTKMDTLKCETYSMPVIDDGHFTHSCSFPTYRWDVMVRVSNTYSGTYFMPVMPDVNAEKFSIVMINGGAIDPKPDNQLVFEYKNRAMINSVAVLPFIRANDEGKKLVFIKGKAVLL